jgi:antitoxin VapB
VSVKDQRLAEFCRANGFDGVWIRRRANVAWAADGADVHCNRGSELGVASIVWRPGRKVVRCDAIEAPRLRAEEFGDAWEFEVRAWHEPETAPEGHFACDWPEDVLTELRAPLTGEELVRARELGRDCADVVQGLLLELWPGSSELDVAGELDARLARRGVRAPVVLVAADERIAHFRHPIPTSRRCERALMLVLCGERRGLVVALTRLVHFGALPDELRRRHDAVCRVDAALLAATRPGALWCDLFELARASYAREGFDGEWRLHHQGGPIGYAPRDFLASHGETRAVRERQLVAWNPSITGTKSEDTITSAGEVLTAMNAWPMRGTRPDILVRRTEDKR